MLKARISNSNIAKLDPRVPFYITELITDEGDNTTSVTMVTNISLDPLQALDSQAHSITIQLLSAENEHPSVLDGVIDPKSITGNIKTINSQTREKYNEFRQAHVLGETKVEVSTVLASLPRGSELAALYEANDHSGVASFLEPNNGMLDVAALKSSIKGKEKILEIAEDIPASTDFQDETSEFFAGDDIPKRFRPNLGTLEEFMAGGPLFDQHVSDVAFYPFPISQATAGIQHAENKVACPYHSDVQFGGIGLLGARDFYPVVLPTLRDISIDDFDETTEISILSAFSLFNDGEDASSTVATAYQQFIAYDESKRQDVVRFQPALKRFPYAATISFSDITTSFPNELVLKMIVKNKNNVTLSTSVFEKNISNMIIDYTRPRIPPIVNLGYSEHGSTADLIDSPVVIVQAEQRDPNASAIDFYKKSGAKQFGLVGSADVTFGEEAEVEVGAEYLDGAGSITFRCVAVNQSGDACGAFTDRTPTEFDMSGASEVSSEFLPAVQTGEVTLTVTPQFDVASSIISVLLDTNLLSEPDLNVESIYDAIQARRIDILSGEHPENIESGEVVVDPAGLEASGKPGNSFIDFGRDGITGVNPGTYTYVIDGLFDDGTDTVPNVTNIPNVEVGPDGIATTDGAFITDDYQYSFVSELATVDKDQTDGMFYLNTEFKIFIEAFTDGFNPAVAFESTSLKFVVDNGNEYELNVYVMDNGSAITEQLAATKSSPGTLTVTFVHKVSSATMLDIGITANDFATGTDFTVSLNPSVKVRRDTTLFPGSGGGGFGGAGRDLDDDDDASPVAGSPVGGPR